jgi:cell division protein FtsI (penicillin-binding protein 3)
MPDQPDDHARAPSPDSPPLSAGCGTAGRAPPAPRRGAPRTGDAIPRMETVRVTAPDLRRRAALERTRSRLVVTAAGFSVLFLAVVLKLTDATVIRPLQPHRPEHKVTAVVAAAKQDFEFGPESRRATITDRNGKILAISLPTVDVFADPRQVIDPAADARKLKSVLPDLDEAVARARLSESTKQFVFLARRITPQQELAVNNLGLPGVDFLPGEERHYPMGRVAAHVLGGVDIDENGVAGVEKWFDKRLTENHSPLRLSLDVRVQAVVRDELAAAMEQFKALGAAGIVMDVNTGEVLAMVSLPDYETGDLGHATEEQRFNRAASGAYEPGSTFKLQTAAMALDDGVIHIWDVFDTVHPIHIGRFTITDFEPEHHNMAVPELIAVSSNIGASHIALGVGAERQRAWLRKLGYFARSPIQLPESAPPIVQPASAWKTATIMTVSFGNGIAVTPTQLIAGTAALVDGGVFHPATLLAASPDSPPAGVRVEQPETSTLMRKLMRIVVTQGTGKPAEIPGYLVGAKTGTSQKVGKGGYKLHANLSSMIAAFPMNAPRYIVYAMLDTPHADKTTFGFTTGGWTAGPAVKRIISRIGPMLGVMPYSPQELAPLEQQLYLPLAPPRPPGAPRDALIADTAAKPTRPARPLPVSGVLPPSRGSDRGARREAALPPAFGPRGRLIEASARESVLAPR